MRKARAQRTPVGNHGHAKLACHSCTHRLAGIAFVHNDAAVRSERTPSHGPASRAITAELLNQHARRPSGPGVLPHARRTSDNRTQPAHALPAHLSPSIPATRPSGRPRLRLALCSPAKLDCRSRALSRPGDHLDAPATSIEGASAQIHGVATARTHAASLLFCSEA